MNKKIPIWLVFLMFVIFIGLQIWYCNTEFIKPLKVLKNKVKLLTKQSDSLKAERELYTLKYQDSLTELRETYKNNIIEADKKIRTLQLKKRAYEKAITEYNNSTLDDKFELFSNLITKDSL